LPYRKMVEVLVVNSLCYVTGKIIMIDLKRRGK